MGKTETSKGKKRIRCPGAQASNLQQGVQQSHSAQLQAATPGVTHHTTYTAVCKHQLPWALGDRGKESVPQKEAARSGSLRISRELEYSSIDGIGTE